MGIESRYPVKRARASRAPFLFALVAAVMLLAQPICEAHRSRPGMGEAALMVGSAQALGAEPAFCCAELEEVAVIAASTWTHGFDESAEAAANSVPRWRVQYPAFSAPLAPDRPPILLPYYARSARILS